MAWGWRGRSWFGPWPGRGPFSYLPPWQRPGWFFGPTRGYCRWLWAYPYNTWIPWLGWGSPSTPQSSKDELAALEGYKIELESEKASIEKEISDVEAKIKELKAMLEKGGK
ncbi:MAG: DUF5320 domain-containing protein [Candidatus Bathyarchaeia archaeon]